MPKIYVVGSINRDLVVYTDRLPEPGETVFGSGFAQFPGGKGANQAVAASRLGGEVHLVGNVGADAFGSAMLAFLTAEAIDTSATATLDSVPTGIALITVDKASENSIVVVSGANMTWDGRDLSSLGIGHGDIIICQFEIPLTIISLLFERSRELGAITILNPAPIQPAPLEMLQNVDYMVVNEIELAALSGSPVNPSDLTSVYAAMRQLRERGPRTIVATLGPRGALLSGPTGEYEVKGHRVDAVDTTGAGDCFIGGFAAALARSSSLSDAIVFANKAAALSVTRRGAASSIPTVSEVNDAEFA